MGPTDSGQGWTRHFVYSTQSRRTTWKLRFGVLGVVLITAVLSRGYWTRSLALSLVCADAVRASDAVLVENFDPTYLLFEQAAALQTAGLARRAIIPVDASAADPRVAELVSREIATLMARVARLHDVELIPAQDIEPISLNVAFQIRDVIGAEGVRSVIVVAPAFRSRRSFLVYQKVLRTAGIEVHCLPVTTAGHRPDNWTHTWHGVQEFTEQFVKLVYYRVYVLPRVHPSGRSPPPGVRVHPVSA